MGVLLDESSHRSPGVSLDLTVTSLLIKAKTDIPGREYKQQHRMQDPSSVWALYATVRWGFYLVDG